METELGAGEVRGRRRIVNGLVATVAVYWTGLAVATFLPAVRLYQRLHGSGIGRVTMGISDRFGAAVTVNGQPVWQWTATWAESAAWILGPPALLWLAWLLATNRRAPRPAAVPPLATATRARSVAALGEPAPAEGSFTRRERQPAPPERPG